MRKCRTCGKPVNNKYCNATCQNDHLYQQYIADWKAGKVDGSRAQADVSKHVRRYLFEKFDNACAKCGWSEIHPVTGKVPLEVEHIDGDWSNNREENLTLLCPNDHALTETYRNLNRGRGRIGRPGGMN